METVENAKCKVADDEQHSGTKHGEQEWCTERGERSQKICKSEES